MDDNQDQLTAQFFDVKTRQKVTRPVIGKVKYLVKGQYRYAFKGKTEDGRSLTTFVKQEVFEAADVPELEA